MKIAVLILAHKNIEQLKRLISVLNHPAIDIYIHLDRKSKLSPADFQHLDVHFTERRFDITLFDFSMVDAEIELLRTASAHGQYGYYLLLSGQCYPLRHIDDIYNYLCKNYPTPLLEVIDTEVVTKFDNVFHHPYALKKFRVHSESILRKYLPSKCMRLSRVIPKFIFYIATLIRGLFVQNPKQRLHAMGIKPYFGQQWWILPDIVLDKVFSFYQNEDFCNCIRDCYSCDETFFQTALMAYTNQFGITINSDGPYSGYYMNKKWFTGPFHNNHPIVLTQAYFDQMITRTTPSVRLFARKFDINIDSTILDMLDRHSLDQYNEEIVD